MKLLKFFRIIILFSLFFAPRLLNAEAVLSLEDGTKLSQNFTLKDERDYTLSLGGDFTEANFSLNAAFQAVVSVAGEGVFGDFNGASRGIVSAKKLLNFRVFSTKTKQNNATVQIKTRSNLLGLASGEVKFDGIQTQFASRPFGVVLRSKTLADGSDMEIFAKNKNKNEKTLVWRGKFADGVSVSLVLDAASEVQLEAVSGGVSSFSEVFAVAPAGFLVRGGSGERVGGQFYEDVGVRVVAFDANGAEIGGFFGGSSTGGASFGGVGGGVNLGFGDVVASVSTKSISSCKVASFGTLALVNGGVLQNVCVNLGDKNERCGFVFGEIGEAFVKIQTDLSEERVRGHCGGVGQVACEVVGEGEFFAWKAAKVEAEVAFLSPSLFADVGVAGASAGLSSTIYEKRYGAEANVTFRALLGDGAVARRFDSKCVAEESSVVLRVENSNFGVNDVVFFGKTTGNFKKTKNETGKYANDGKFLLTKSAWKEGVASGVFKLSVEKRAVFEPFVLGVSVEGVVGGVSVSGGSASGSGGSAGGLSKNSAGGSGGSAGVSGGSAGGLSKNSAGGSGGSDAGVSASGSDVSVSGVSLNGVNLAVERSQVAVFYGALVGNGGEFEGRRGEAILRVLAWCGECDAAAFGLGETLGGVSGGGLSKNSAKNFGTGQAEISSENANLAGDFGVVFDKTEKNEINLQNANLVNDKSEKSVEDGWRVASWFSQNGSILFSASSELKFGGGVFENGVWRVSLDYTGDSFPKIFEVLYASEFGFLGAVYGGKSGAFSAVFLNRDDNAWRGGEGEVFGVEERKKGSKRMFW